MKFLSLFFAVFVFANSALAAEFDPEKACSRAKSEKACDAVEDPAFSEKGINGIGICAWDPEVKKCKTAREMGSGAKDYE